MYQSRDPLLRDRRCLSPPLLEIPKLDKWLKPWQLVQLWAGIQQHSPSSARCCSTRWPWGYLRTQWGCWHRWRWWCWWWHRLLRNQSARWVAGWYWHCSSPEDQEEEGHKAQNWRQGWGNGTEGEKENWSWNGSLCFICRGLPGH